MQRTGRQSTNGISFELSMSDLYLTAAISKYIKSNSKCFCVYSPIFNSHLNMTISKKLTSGKYLVTAFILLATLTPHAQGLESREPINQQDSLSRTTQSTFLVIATDKSSSREATSGLRGYGIPYEEVILPKSGISLPVLNNSATIGNYGAIVIMKGALYESSKDTWTSALSEAQIKDLYSYQTAFGVRMVQIDVWPSSDFGVKIQSTSCCSGELEQNVSISNSTGFPTAGLKT